MFAPPGLTGPPAPIFLSKEAKIVFYLKTIDGLDICIKVVFYLKTIFDKKNGARRPLGRRRNDFYQKNRYRFFLLYLRLVTRLLR
jgi:hypothetical protein